MSVNPEVYVPVRRKEVHFFDRYFERGLSWYEEFFPIPGRAATYRAIGEITPDYLFEPSVPERIAKTLPDCRFVVSLRHPTGRAFSAYLHHLRAFNEKRTFDRFVEEQDDAAARGFYTTQLKRYFAHFPRDRFLILIFEEWVRDPEQTVATLADFLELSKPWQEPARLFERKVVGSQIPYLQRAFYHTRRLGQTFTRHDQDWVVNLARQLGVRRLFGTRRKVPSMSAQARERLEALYAPEIEEVERLLGREIPAWRD